MDKTSRKSFIRKFLAEKYKNIKYRIYRRRSITYYHLFFKKKFAHIEAMPAIWGIWNIEVSGPNISLGKNIVILSARGSRIRLTTVKLGEYEGSIEIGSNILLMDGIRISSASKVVIGDNCMLAGNCYITDADWHGVHNRAQAVGKTAPVILENGAWIGDSSIICKGVTIGENSIVGAGSVVREDIPPNVIVAGNPAQIVGKLDPEKVHHIGGLYEIFGGPKL